MRRFSCFLALSAVFTITACGDDKKTPSADTVSVQDTTTGTDVATTDVAGTDTSTADVAVMTDVTTTPDTTVQTDTTVVPPDLGEGTCLGMVACVDDCTTEECETACLAASDSEAETAALTALNTCLATNACVPASDTPTDAEVRAAANCARDNCVAESVTCYQGETTGTGPCPAIRGCVTDCEDDLRCARGCFQAATSQNAQYYFQLRYCLDSECYSSTQFPNEVRECRINAETIQPCSVDASQCGINVIGAAPGAGPGGGE